MRVIVFTSQISPQDKKKLDLIAKEFKTSLEFITLKDDLFDGLTLNYHFKKSNYYRLFAAEFLQEEICLYLDADIIVAKSLNKLLEIKLNDFFVAAVEEPGFDRHQELSMKPESKYFNSGVMLINLEKWRSTKLKDSVIAFVKEKPDKVQFVDQCGLNSVIDGQWIELDSMFNFQSAMLEGQFVKKSFLDELPEIIHFTGSGKPWHLNNKHPYRALYWHYRNQTPYKKFFPDDLSASTVLRFLTQNLKQKFFKSIVRIFN
jgi:lipopolysaccharide biosynthesis glycosyltransferase